MTNLIQPRHPSIFIPALRAVMGDNVYFVTTLSLKEVAQRVSFAREVHSSDALNDLIQRRLSESRAEQIGEYLIREDQRFFNALVVGVYAGDPTWQTFGKITSDHPSNQDDIPESATDTFGFLKLEGTENLFAIDGQHRLAGIKNAVGRDISLEPDRVTVIFIAHRAGEEGLIRTRRLFTVLNKTARPVLKGDIIALDEDDLMAICTRRLVNECGYFSGKRVAMRLRNSLTPTDNMSWTTITMLYDILTLLFVKAYPECQATSQANANELKRSRASDEVINEYYNFAVEYFDLLCNHFPEVKEVLGGDADNDSVTRYRHSKGGHILYRPLGQKVFTQIVVLLCQKYTIAEAMGFMAELPTELACEPYSGIVWNPSKGTMVNSGSAAALVKDMLLFMLGEPIRRSHERLLSDYAGHLNTPEDEVELPAKLFC
mgnify:CR=1 FL=1